MDGTHHEDQAQAVLAAPILRQLHAVIAIEDVADLAEALGKSQAHMFAVEVSGELGVYVAMDAGRERLEVPPSRVDR